MSGTISAAEKRGRDGCGSRRHLAFYFGGIGEERRRHLWSIDLPPIEKTWQKQVGLAVPDRLANRWTHIKGLSRLHLPKPLSQLGQIELFVHDSMHSERNVRFELDRAWAKLKPGGGLVVDDVDANWGFHTFTQTVSGCQSIICEAEPLHPDVRRFNKKGLFGILLKDPLTGRSQGRLERETA